MLHANGSGRISVEHLTAADHLRLAADGARIGFSANRDLSMPIQAAMYRPPLGPSRAAQRQERCAREFQRCMRLFDDGQRDLIEAVILKNTTVARWRLARGIRYESAMAILLGVLDELVRHFRGEIDRFGVAA